MADAYGTDFQAMQKAAQSVQQVQEEIQAEMRSLESALAPVASAWKGSAASAFQQLMARFQEDGQKLTQALGAIGEAMGANTKNYNAVEESSASSISTLLQSLT